jgi:hypothetical protein
VLFAGTALKPTGLAGNFLSALTVPATAQAVTAEGAYTTLGASNGAMSVKLSDVAEIDDVAGNGQYAIGRWKVGSFDVTTPTVNNTQTLRANQAAPYAVGIPWICIRARAPARWHAPTRHRRNRRAWMVRSPLAPSMVRAARRLSTWQRR